MAKTITRTGPYKHTAKATVTLTVSDIGSTGKTKDEARLELFKIGKEMELALRRYWRVGPRAKGFSFDVQITEETGP